MARGCATVEAPAALGSPASGGEVSSEVIGIGKALNAGEGETKGRQKRAVAGLLFRRSGIACAAYVRGMRDSAPAPSTVGPTRRGWLLGASLAAVTAATTARTLPSAPPDPGRRLPEAVRQCLAASGLPLEHFGVHVQPVDGGSALVALNAETPCVMASTAKTVTSMAALDLLGPRYRWRTRAYARGLVVEGHLYGDLILVGGGDVLLTTAALRDWFREIAARGLRQVHGRILLDRSAFRLDERDFASTPEPAPDRPHHVRPNALMLDAGVVRVAVQPARGPRAAIRIAPPLEGVALLNGVGMGGGCFASAVFRARERQLAVQGSWGATCGEQDIAFAPLPVEELTRRAVAELWREIGGVLSGSVEEQPLDLLRNTTTPQARKGQTLALWSVHRSPELTQWVHDMNKSSDNVAARHLLLSLAPGFPGSPATPRAALTRLQGWLLRRGLQADDIRLDNGSGLSRAERARPRALVHLLRQAWTARWAEPFIDSLPVAGVDGTLAHRLTGAKVQGRARLKTGTLLDVRALAGYVQAASGRWYAMAAMTQHPQAAQATASLDGLVQWVVAHG